MSNLFLRLGQLAIHCRYPGETYYLATEVDKHIASDASTIAKLREELAEARGIPDDEYGVPVGEYIAAQAHTIAALREHLAGEEALRGHAVAALVRVAAERDKLREQLAEARDALKELVKECENVLDLHPGISQWSIRSALQTADVVLSAHPSEPKGDAGA